MQHTLKHGLGAPVDPRLPFVLADRTDTPRITAVDSAAEACGLAVGETLADARARVGALEVRLADPAADAKALARLAQWATRYTPSVALFKGESGSDGLFLDVTGAAHLVGGEEKLLADLARRLAAFGLPARLTIAETPGTAWAVSHFAPAPRVIVPAGAEAQALALLPVEGLRLAPETALTLRRLGFKRIGLLIGMPRAPFAARFERELLRRLDQALGNAPEPLALRAPPPVYENARSLLEPITTEDAIVAAATRLMQDLVPRLEADGVGVRNVELSLYRVDGLVQRLDVGLALPTQSPDHIARLLRLKLERMARLIEAGYGFETVRLAVTVTERMEPRQHGLGSAPEDEARARRCTTLNDALRQRLGPNSVRHLMPVTSHWPERSEKLVDERSEKLVDVRSEKLVDVRSENLTDTRSQALSTPQTDAAPWPSQENACPRPPLMLPHAEPADVIALVPDGPPLRLRWRGRLHTVTHAQGPERIAAEWWRARPDTPTRDYYLVEDETGRRLWLYREHLPDREGLARRETAASRWFVHGLFP